MNKKLLFSLTVIMTILVVTMACSLTGSKSTGGGEEKPAGEAQQQENKPEAAKPTEEKPPQEQQPQPDQQQKPQSGQTGGGDKKSIFPLPDDAKVMLSDDKTVVFTTTKSLDDMVAFYRDAFSKQGLKESKLHFVTSDSTFSMVFTGAKDGMEIVTQGTKFQENTSVSIRYEDVIK